MIFGQFIGQNDPQNISYFIYGLYTFRQVGLKFFGNLRDSYLSIGGEKSCFWCFFERNPIFGGEMDVATTMAPKGLGPQDPTKKLAKWVELSGHSLSRKHVFRIFGPNPPPLLNKKNNGIILKRGYIRLRSKRNFS